MFYIIASFCRTLNKGTAHEYKSQMPDRFESGPFETRASAEGFARGIASQPDLVRVDIQEREAN